MSEVPQPSDKRMKLRFAGVCRLCGTSLPALEVAIYERSTKTVRCVECPIGFAGAIAATPGARESAEQYVMAEEVDGVGVAGASARREHERRKSKDEQRIRQKWGKFGGIAVALSDEKQSTKAWATGAIGEERLGARLDSLVSESVAVLHDRRIPGTRANIDHIAVTTAGVWVIDAKHYKGRPELKVEGGILSRRVEKLRVNRRDQTSLVGGVLNQIYCVRKVLEDVPVTGALCFVDADWPLVGGAFTISGVHVLGPRRLAKLLVDAQGSFDVGATLGVLASHFKCA